MNYEKGRRAARMAGKVLLAAVSAVLTAAILLWMAVSPGGTAGSRTEQAGDLALMDRFDQFINNAISNALEGVLSVKKVYWLNDSDPVAPEPDPARGGSTNDPAVLEQIISDAAPLLDGQQLLFRTDLQRPAGSDVTYYRDDTILSLTWKQIIDNACYTISEVKISHPSQLRRFMAGDEYGHDKQYFPTDLAASVNAVTAASGDFYKFRPYGVVVYHGQVHRVNSALDVCYFDDRGDMLFTRRGELTDRGAAEQFVEDHHIRFSLSFGPILVENGENVAPGGYIVGEINDQYSRAAVAQMGELHYLLINVNREFGARTMPEIRLLAKRLQEFGCIHAYALDGGQTGAIIANDRLINRPDWGNQRRISDIVYFATAIPQSESGARG